MEAKTNKEIINYILKFATLTNIDIIAYLNILHPTDNPAEDLENYLFPDEDIDIDAAEEISTILGVDILELMLCNERWLKHYLDSYNYFKLYKEFESMIESCSNDSTLGLFSFPMIVDFINAYCELCADYLILFIFYIKEGSLDGADKCLFNFLASVLNAQDLVYLGDDLLNSDLVEKFRKVYENEIDQYNIMSIVVFKTKWLSDLWRCIELEKNPKIITKLDRYAPGWRDYVKDEISEALNQKKPMCVTKSDDSNIMQLSDHHKAVWVYNILELYMSAPYYYRTPEDKLLDCIFGEEKQRVELRFSYETEL